MAQIKIKIEAWKKLLLDLGKRNRLLNFKETKRSNVKIDVPSCDKLYEEIVLNEKALKFPFARKIKIDDDGEESFDSIIEGDLTTNKTPSELQKTLKVLRSKSKLSIEEQGINTLYLTFGLLKWKETETSDQALISPLVLVPVSITNESLTSPYVLQIHEDEIVVNPTLVYKLSNDFGIELPEFDADNYHITSYLHQVNKKVEFENWEVVNDVNVTLLSFLKINMYKDLERNEEKLSNNPIVSAIAGDSDPIFLPEGYDNFDHDNKIRPIDTYQVVDADSSQQDAILLSKNGASFVLQGPPGTGKSQTITNIISEALADGKKVLFVSEKMAALQVVHKRLSQVGLAEFCLTLHSHKANKKEILKELSNSINMNKVSVREEALNKLNELEYLREKINKYHIELHSICLPLNKSIFEVNGILAKFDNISDIVFDVSDVENFTIEKLNTNKNLLDEFSKTIGKMSDSFSENPWYNSIVDNATFALRHEIDANFTSTIPLLTDLLNLTQKANSEFKLSIPLTITNIVDLEEVLFNSSQSPIIPIHWITDINLESFITQTSEYKTSFDIIKFQTEYLKKYYDIDIFTIDGNKLQFDFNEAIDNLKSLINCSTGEKNSVIFDSSESVVKESKFIHSSLEKILIAANPISEAFGIQCPNRFPSLLDFATILKLLMSKIKPTEVWFDNDSDTGIQLFLKDATSIHNEANNLSQTILSDYEKEIFEIDSISILKRYRTDYRSIFHYLNSQYRKDKKSVQELSLKSVKVNDKEIILLLCNIKNYADKVTWINENKAKLESFFGSYYKGIMTNWFELSEAIANFHEVLNLLPEKAASKRFKSIFVDNDLPYEEILNFNNLYSSINLQDLLSKTEVLIGRVIDDNENISKLIKSVYEIYEDGCKIRACYTTLREFSVEEISTENFITSIDYLSNIQMVERSLESRKTTLQKEYAFLWAGSSTDWDFVLSKLDFAANFKKLVTKYSLPSFFINLICTDCGSIAMAGQYSREIHAIKNKVDEKLCWIINLFDPSEDFLNINLTDLINRLTDCYSKKTSLEEWIDYRNNRKKCQEVGLTDFIEKIESEQIPQACIVRSYLKRFYRLWLDQQMPKYPTVQSFRRRNHESDIEEFKSLDCSQMVIARSRVRESVLRSLPDFNSATSSRDEVGILRRELNKQRKLLPLRKLFNSIPNILTTLKPCLMMSPLSVSVFLEAQSYEFDMVVFDEASQVCTEDAIGAIMRGKQVIIVGDSKQLPPTNFFATTLSDADFDTESDEVDDTGAYESILDEALNVIPELSLRWHYRSRHEHLIAFSNAKIYDNKLVTFPSFNEDVKDFGVEYIYVPDGIYDRGGKRNNIIEANKVTDLVFEHFKTHPNRSLGVVTFSEAQQQAIDMAIRQRRLANSTFDQFFSEDKDEAFFIKNLENVQGDERDTIIFSIGYAKDSKGIMYMSFGPLSRDGGFRRLNVAITRAKFNLKLVGSILSTDIDTDKITSEGAKMLRSYIEFARNGITALQSEFTYPATPELESPFEESVYDFLVSKGFKTVTQVGCSGFRIDMAVRHSKLSGVFVLGIECDGATYHASRTARERDRLRQSVLEDIGWRIYRIWSTDWIKDPISEGQKLLSAIENAMLLVDNPTLGFDCEVIKPVVVNTKFEEDIVNAPHDNSGYGFEFYEVADIENVNIDEDDDGEMYSRDVIHYILETEQPIHFELLCKRIAPIWNNQKATSRIRANVEYVLRNEMKRDILYKNYFISLSTMESVKVRVPNPDSNDSVRPIQYIAVEEVAKAMAIIAKHSYGIKSEDLMVATAREFGFNRSGANITLAMQNAYKLLFKKAKIKELDDKVVVL